MLTNKTIEIGNSQIVLYHDSKTNLIGIISGNVGDIHCIINGSVILEVKGNVGGVGGNVLGGIGGNVLGGIGGYVKDGIKGHVGGDVLRVDGNVLNDVKGRVLGRVVGGVGSDDNKQIENKTGDNMKHEGSFLETVLDGIQDGHKDGTVDGVKDSNKNEIENDNKNETGDKMEQGDSEVKMKELGSLQYMYERMQQIRQGRRDGYINKLDEALDSFEAIMLAEKQLYEAVDNCKDGTDTHKSTETHNHTETDKVTDTVMPDEGKKKDGGKEVDGGKKAKHDLADENKTVTTLPADDEEVATINALIDKVERYRKDGNFNYDENDVKETPENFEYRTTRQSLINFYGQMLKEQRAGSYKWNHCIQKYQDVFPVNGFIVAVNMSKQGGDSMMANTKYKFGTHQSTLHNVYKEMRALAATGSHKWDTCIKAYKEAFPISSKRYAITQETVFYLNNKG